MNWPHHFGVTSHRDRPKLRHRQTTCFNHVRFASDLLLSSPSSSSFSALFSSSSPISHKLSQGLLFTCRGRGPAEIHFLQFIRSADERTDLRLRHLGQHTNPGAQLNEPNERQIEPPREWPSQVVVFMVDVVVVLGVAVVVVRHRKSAECRERIEFCAWQATLCVPFTFLSGGSRGAPTRASHASQSAVRRTGGQCRRRHSCEIIISRLGRRGRRRHGRHRR